MNDQAEKHSEAFVDSNYRAFVELLPTLIREHKDKYALMCSNKLKGVYSTFEDAEQAGKHFVPDNKYIIQHISQEPIDLGIFSRAGALM